MKCKDVLGGYDYVLLGAMAVRAFLTCKHTRHDTQIKSLLARVLEQERYEAVKRGADSAAAGGMDEEEAALIQEVRVVGVQGRLFSAIE